MSKLNQLVPEEVIVLASTDRALGPLKFILANTPPKTCLSCGLSS